MHSPPGVSKEDNMEQKQIIAVAIVAILVISAGVAAVLIMGGGSDDAGETEYTVTYNVNGGNDIAAKTFTKKTDTFSLETPVKSGATFLGWYDNAQFTGSKITQVVKGTQKSINVWAKWQLNMTQLPSATDFASNSSVEVRLDEGSEVTASPELIDAITEGKALTVNNVDEQGNTIFSWTFNGSDSKNDGYAGGAVNMTVTPDLSKKDLEKKITLDFAFDGILPYSSTITYFVGMGYAGESMFVKNADDSEFIGPIDVDSNGYLTFDIDHCSDWILQVYYTLTFNANGGVFADGSTVKAIYGAYNHVFAPAEVPVPTMNGNTLTGWDEELPSNFTEDNSFSAEWTPCSYGIEYHHNGGAFESGHGVASYTYGVGATLDESIRPGYSFAGWYDNEGLQGSPIRIIGATDTGAKEFYADWNVTIYSITYKDGDRTLGTGSYTTVDSEITLTTTYVKDGYDFTAWYENEGLTGTPVETIPTGSYDNKVFFAKWTPKVNTITYMDGITELGTSQYTIEDATFNLPTTYTKEGQAFSGWYDNAALAGERIVSIQQGTFGDKTFYAKWEAYYIQVTVKVDGVNESDAVSRTITAKLGEATAVPLEKMSAGVYKWTSTQETPVAASGTYKILVDNVVIIDELVVSNGRGEGDINYYTVDFDVEGVSTQTILSGGCAVMPTAPEQIGYTFNFWRAIGETAYNFATPVTSHLDLYATWNPLSYVVVYLKNDEAATGTMSDGMATFGLDFTPAECGFIKEIGETVWRFVGWNTRADLEGETLAAGTEIEIDEDIVADIIDGNIVLHAMWSNVDFVPTLGDVFTGTMSAYVNNEWVPLDMKSVIVSLRGEQYLLETLTRINGGAWELEDAELLDSDAWPVFGGFFDAIDMAVIQSLPGTPGTHLLNGSPVNVTRYNVPVEGQTYSITVDVVNSTGMVCYISELTVYKVTISIDTFVPGGFSETHSVRYQKLANSETIVTRSGTTYVDAHDLGFSVEDKMFLNWTALVNGYLPEPYFAGDLITTDRTVVGSWGYVSTNINWDIKNLPEGLAFNLHDGNALLEDAAVNDIMTLPGTSDWRLVDEADDANTYSFRLNNTDYTLSVYLYHLVSYSPRVECHSIVPSLSAGALNIRFAESHEGKFFAKFVFSMNAPELKGYEAHVGDRFIYDLTYPSVIRYTYEVTQVPVSDYNNRYLCTESNSITSDVDDEEFPLFEYPVQAHPSDVEHLWHIGAYRFGSSDVQCYYFEESNFTQADGNRNSSRDTIAVVGVNDGMTYDGWYRLFSYTVENDPVSLHNVTFNGNGGSIGDDTVVTKRTYGVTEVEFQRAGFDLLGWSTENDNTAEYTTGDSINEDCTLYAVWGFDGARAVVNLNGGESSESLTTFITAPMGSAREDVFRADRLHAQKAGQVGIGVKIGGATLSGWDALIFSAVQFQYVMSGQILGESYVEVAPGVYVSHIYTNPSSSAVTRATNAYVYDGSDMLMVYLYEGHDVELVMQYGAGATVVYDPGTGTGAPITIQVPLNGAYVLLPDGTFTKENWEFKGWKDDAGYTGPSPRNNVDNANGLGFNYGVESITLHAVWGSYVDVHYDANGGTLGKTADVRCVADGNVTDKMVYGKWNDECTREGYKLVGWATAANATTVEYVCGTFFTFDVSQTGQRITLYAIWASEDDAFEFRLDKGNYTPPGSTGGVTSWSSNPQNLVAGVTMPIVHYSYDTSRAKKCLVGWNTSADGTGTAYNLGDTVRFDVKPGESFVLYAQWAQLTVYFDANGGTGSMDPIHVNYNESTVLPSNGFLKPGYGLVGWICDPDLGTLYQPCIVPGSEPGVYGIRPMKSTIPTCTLSPIWVELHTVTFDTQGGTAIAPAQVLDGRKVSAPGSEPERGGYTFNGWFTQASGGEEFDFEGIVIEDDVTIYAQWTAHAYDLVLDYQTVGEVDDVIKCVNGVGVTLPEDVPERVGYTFEGWHCDTECECDSGFYQPGETYYVFLIHDGDELTPFVPNEDDVLRLYARWSPVSYTIKFHANGGTGDMTDQVKIFDSGYINSNEFTYEGCGFYGWNTSADGSGTPIDDCADDVVEISEVVNLYAQWTALCLDVMWGSVTVTFDTNYGYFLMYGPITGELSCGSGATATIPAPLVPVKAGYIFEGWHCSCECDCTSGFYQPGESYVIKVHYGDELVPLDPDCESVTLYAIWTPIEYTVEFNANGGMGSMSNQSRTYDEGYLSECTFTCAGYYFDCWNTEADGSGVSYSNESGDNLTETDGATIRLYAQWIEE